MEDDTLEDWGISTEIPILGYIPVAIPEHHIGLYATFPPKFRFPVQGQLELGQVLELRVPFSLTIEWLLLFLFRSISGSKPLYPVRGGRSAWKGWLEEGDELLSLIGSDLVDRDEDKDEEGYAESEGTQEVKKKTTKKEADA
ncbi:hypothetical protein ACFE04_019695 [Oxalis oulophora]